MDRIDHYPQTTDSDITAGRIAGEIRAMREQQERLYYRDEALNDSTPIKEKSKSTSVVTTEITPFEATRIIVTQTPNIQPNDFADGCMTGIFIAIVGLTLILLYI